MKKTKKLIAIFSTVFTTGLIIGLVRFVNEIIANQYIRYGMYSIVIQRLPNILNKWVIMSSIFAAGLIALYLMLPLFAGLAKTVWRLLFSDSVQLHVNDTYRVKSGIAILFSTMLFLCGGWAVNYYWLPGKFHIYSLLFDGAFFLCTILFGLLLIRTAWGALFNRIVERNYPLKAAALAVIVLLASNVYSVIDSKRTVSDRPNVIFICIDALRADHLGSYGYTRDTSPFIDQLTQKGAMFTNVTSQSSWTKTSVATFLTSDYEMLSRIVGEEDKLPPEVNTLAEILKNHGYTTGAFVANPWLLPQFGFKQGFDYYNTQQVMDDRGRRIKVEDITAYLDKIKKRKFFLYVHFMDVHSPYHPPAPYDQMFTGEKGSYRYRNGKMIINKDDLDKTVGLYDGEIRSLDEKISILFRYLNKQHLLRNTLVIINADHGDEFMEHGGMGHGTTLYRELLHVPLFILPPDDIDIERSIIPSPVRSIDIVPTILDILKIQPVTDIDGVSLLELIKGGHDFSPPAALSAVRSHNLKDSLISLSNARYHYIYNISKHMNELYDLQNDPGEKENLVSTKPELAGKMHDEMENLSAEYLHNNASPSAKTSINKETLETLKSLGYIQ